MTNRNASPHPVHTLSAGCAHTNTDTGNQYGDKNRNGQIYGIGDKQGERGLEERSAVQDRAQPSRPEPVAPSETVLCRSHPRAYLLLACLRANANGKPVPINSATIHPCRVSPNTLRQEIEFLVRVGLLQAVQSELRYGAGPGRPPTLYTIREKAGA